MTAPIIAPDGVIFALLAIAAGAPLTPDEAAETWLTEQGLLAFDEASSLTVITERGRVWLDMIGSTPLPMKVSLWSDPRGDVTKPAEPAGLAAALTDIAATLKALRTAPPAIAQRPPSARLDAAHAAPPAEGEIPAGYNPNRWPDSAAGFLPPGLQRDVDIEVIRRDGKRLRNIAGVVLWKHLGKPEDVMAWRQMVGGDAMIVPVQLAPT